MKIGVGIPNSIPAADASLLVEWARRAEELGFASLSTIGRVVYPTYEELILLTAAAMATERVELVTGVLLGPTREPLLLAKQAASLDQISRGRLVLGVSAGSRQDDFEVTGMGFNDRGRRWDHDLELLHQAWRGQPLDGTEKPVCPLPYNGERVRVLIGGQSDGAVRRAVRWGIGWMAGGGGPDLAAGMFEKVRGAWTAAGRLGTPDLRALNYFALGPSAETGEAYLRDYYGPFADYIWPSTPRDDGAVRDLVRRFEDVGTDQLLFSPVIASLDQLDRLAQVVL
jgi:alkanesulfonate monooxygenase SsuD/methylene tetrahydromethanopterin reductase-like flavin-dependent oxidoreductase (luciferase family)